MNWLWAHWELKLVSMAVAVALWTYTSGQVRVERQVLIEVQPEQVVGLPPNLRVAAVTPAAFQVVLSVPTSKLDMLRGDVLRPELHLPRDLREPGTVNLAMTSRSLGLDADIRLISTEPANIRSIQIQVSDIEFATINLQAPDIVDVPSGILVTVHLDRTRVDVQGPRELVERARQENRVLRFQPIHYDNLGPSQAAGHEERLVLIPLPGQPDPVTPVLATVSIHSALTSESTLRVRYAILQPLDDAGRWRIVAMQPDIELRCTGTAQGIRDLNASDISAWVDLRKTALTAGPNDFPVFIQAPPGVVVAPLNVRLVLTPNP